MINGSLSANTIDLHIDWSGYVNLTPAWNKPDGYNRSTRLYFVKSGEGYLKTETETIPLEAGYVYLIPSRLHYAYGCSRLSKLFFHIKLSNGDLIDRLRYVGRICRMPFPREDLDRLMEYYTSEDCLDLIHLKAILFHTVSAILQTHHIPPIPITSYSEPVSRAIMLIQAAPSIRLTAADVSHQLFISESRLRNTFRKEVGISFGEYIDKLVLQKAKQMLRDPVRTIGQISQLLGFCDQFYFSRRFKQMTGKTPSEYRKGFLSEDP